jgi:cold shock CspA family protein
MKDDGKRLGIVNTWIGDKGYGFIRTAVENFKGEIVRINDRAVADTFLHITQLQRADIADIAVGDILRFDLTTCPRTMKPRAANIERIGHTDDQEKTAAAA